MLASKSVLCAEIRPSASSSMKGMSVILIDRRGKDLITIVERTRNNREVEFVH